LRGVSGTTLNGTSLLGLYQAAIKTGFNAAGYEARIQSLKEITSPVILHILKDGRVDHFVVCYGYDNGGFVIGDPGEGIVRFTEGELEAVWVSKTLLQLAPGKDFITKKAESENRWKWFFQLTREDIPLLGIASFLGIVMSVLSLATAIFTQKLIDGILPGKNVHGLNLGLIVFALVLVARAAVGYVRSVILTRQGRDMNKRLVSGFFGKLLYLPASFFDSVSTGDMVARLNDSQRIQRVVGYLGSQIIIDLLVFLVSAAAIFFYSVSSGVISLLSAPLFLLIAWFYNHKVIVSQREVMQTYAATESRYIDAISRIESIKSFRAERIFAGVVNGVYGFFMQKVYHLGILGAGLNFWVTMGSTLLLTGIISWNATMVLNGQLLIGEMMAIITLIGVMGSSVVNIALANIQYQEARIAFDRMYEFASAEPEYQPETEIKSGKREALQMDGILVEELSFRFPGKKLLLNKISFSVRKGEMVTFFGEVGCGKSTLLDILQRFHPAESGSVWIDGADWNRISTPEWRGMVAGVPQHVQLFNATILENICLGEKPDAEQIVRFCTDLGFHEFIMEFQQGYATIVGENSTNLSGGQRQLIALARALYHQPQLLLLDEATAAMDRRTEKFVVGLLQRMKSTMAVIFVTHRPQLAKYSDRIYIIENKTISDAGPHRLLLQSSSLYRNAFEEVAICH
jgi:ATP-binding cassette subfamily B protein